MKSIEEIKEKLKAGESYTAKTPECGEYIRGFIAALRWMLGNNQK